MIGQPSFEPGLPGGRVLSQRRFLPPVRDLIAAFRSARRVIPNELSRLARVPADRELVIQQSGNLSRHPLVREVSRSQFKEHKEQFQFSIPLLVGLECSPTSKIAKVPPGRYLSRCRLSVNNSVEREEQTLTVYQVSDITKIKTDHVRAIEEGLRGFPAPVYVRGFVRTYAVVEADAPPCWRNWTSSLARLRSSAIRPLAGERKARSI